jgi:LemA protein
MLAMVIAIIVVVAIVVIAVLYYIAKRNSIIASRNRVDESWSGIDVQLKRRHDLVPNLVETVKGYAAHESQVFEKVTQARADAMSAQGVGDTAKAEQGLTGALAGLRAVAENYPQLRATENFQQLSRNLSELEDEIQASRRIYNSNVQSYNTAIQQFPGSIIANQGGFEKREYFEIDDAAEREPVSVSFGDKPG